MSRSLLHLLRHLFSINQAVAACRPLRLGVALRPLANALRLSFPPGPLALKVLTILRVEVLGALGLVGTLILARRLPRELPRACRRRRRRRRRGRGRRRRRRRCAHVTVIPGLAWRVSNTLFLRARRDSCLHWGCGSNCMAHSVAPTWDHAWCICLTVYMLCIHGIEV